jgi:hypothetical protein
MTRLPGPTATPALLLLVGLALAGCASGARSRQDEDTLADCRQRSEAIQNRQNRGAGYRDATIGTPFAGPQLPSNPVDQMTEKHSYLSDVDSCVRGSAANLRGPGTNLPLVPSLAPTAPAAAAAPAAKPRAATAKAPPPPPPPPPADAPTDEQ